MNSLPKITELAIRERANDSFFEHKYCVSEAHLRKTYP